LLSFAKVASLTIIAALVASIFSISPLPVMAAQSSLSGALLFPSNGSNFPMRNSYFEVWKDGFLGVATFVTSGTTDLNSHFTATFSGDCNCWVSVFTRAPGAVDVFCPVEAYLLCAPLPGQSPTFHSAFAKVHVNDGQSLDYGTQVLPTVGLIAEAARIADIILTAWLFTQSQTGISVRQVSVQFPCGVLCPGSIYFNPYVIRDVYMQSGESATRITHEYGHFVMLSAYDPSGGGVVATVWPVPVDKQLACLVHFITTACVFNGAQVREIGWTEGWADFFSMAVLNNPQAWGTDLETPSGAGFTTGDAVEGRVAAALWDLFAPSSPSSDHFGVGFAPIFDALFRHKTHSTFQAFYDDFRNTHPDLTWKFNAAAFQNSINYNNPPRIISLTVPTGTAQGSASLSVKGADDGGGFVDGFLSSATFEFSKDGGTRWLSLGTQSSGLTSPPSSPTTTISLVWVFNSSIPSVIVRARVSDNLGVQSDWTQSAPFAIQQGSAGIPEFPFQLGIALLFTIAIVLSYLIVRRVTIPRANLETA